MVKSLIDTGEPLDEIIFCNTGLETPETYDFLRACDEQLFNGRLVIVEWSADGPGFRLRSHDDLDDEGRTFRAFVNERNYLPNRYTRICTHHLKIRTAYRYLYATSGGHTETAITEYIGLRADEPQRIARIRGANEAYAARESEGKPPLKWTSFKSMPLVKAHMNRESVLRAWSEITLDCGVNPADPDNRLSNCAGCFFSNRPALVDHARKYPLHMLQWAAMEADIGASVNRGFTYSDILDEAAGEAGQADLGLTDAHYGGCSDGYCGLDI